MPGSTDARCPMHVQTDRPNRGKRRLTRMQPHAHRHGHTLGPGRVGKSLLCCYGRCNRLCGTLEDREEAVPRGVDLVTIPPLEHLTQQAPVLLQHLSIPVAQVLEEACGVLNVAAQEGDSATG